MILRMKISIIIPAYNAERYIDRCFKSVYSDGLPEERFEVVVINDGSKDKTLELLHAWRDKHKNITIIDKENEGVSVARNVGIEAATGEYVLFLDVDDELVEGSLTKVYSYLEENGPMDMLVTRQLRNNGEKEWMATAPTLGEHRVYDGVEAFKSHYVRTNAGGGICRREFLKNHNLTFPEGITNGEDTLFFGHLQVYAESIVYYNLPLYRINQEPESASRTPDYTLLAKGLASAIPTCIKIKNKIKASEEQKAVFDYVVYQQLSNTIYYFTRSKELNYIQFRRDVDLSGLLPLNVKQMYIMKGKAMIMNISCSLFYFLSWLK